MNTTATNYYNHPSGKSGLMSRRKLLFALPAELHGVIAEVTFRERITLTKFVESAARDLIDRMDEAESRAEDRYSVVRGHHRTRFDEGQLVHPTVFLPEKIVSTLRDAAHYGKRYGVISHRRMIIEALLEHLKDYSDKYPDVVRIEELISHLE